VTERGGVQKLRGLCQTLRLAGVAPTGSRLYRRLLTGGLADIPTPQPIASLRCLKMPVSEPNPGLERVRHALRASGMPAAAPHPLRSGIHKCGWWRWVPVASRGSTTGYRLTSLWDGARRRRERLTQGSGVDSVGAGRIVNDGKRRAIAEMMTQTNHAGRAEWSANAQKAVGLEQEFIKKWRR